MGIEGNIRQHYYAAWNAIVNQEINFNKRVMHPPDNMINSLISFVNSLIYAKTLSEVYHTQLNPTISYLHEPGARRFSLCLDISEIFKPLIGDRLIFSLLNKRQITEDSFTKELNFLHLKTRPINSPIIPELATQPHQIPHPAIISVNIWPINPMENPTRGPNKAENIASRAMAGFS